MPGKCLRDMALGQLDGCEMGLTLDSEEGEVPHLRWSQAPPLPWPRPGSADFLRLWQCWTLSRSLGEHPLLRPGLLLNFIYDLLVDVLYFVDDILFDLSILRPLDWRDIDYDLLVRSTS